MLHRLLAAFPFACRNLVSSTLRGGDSAASTAGAKGATTGARLWCSQTNHTWVRLSLFFFYMFFFLHWPCWPHWHKVPLAPLALFVGLRPPGPKDPMGPVGGAAPPPHPPWHILRRLRLLKICRGGNRGTLLGPQIQETQSHTDFHQKSTSRIVEIMV